jgi:microcystin-dependent protein
LPESSTNSKGIVELATNSEAVSGTDTSRAVTPAGLKSAIEDSTPPNASTTVKGIVEFATNAEAEEGLSNTTKAMTPAATQTLIDYNAPPNASTTTKGIVELATNGETESGTDSTRAVTPSGLKSWSDERGVYGEDNNEMVGSVAYFVTTVAPDGWIKANGAEVGRSAYAKLFAKVGEFWGAGNGSTTFNLPDLRGEFIRAWDDGRGADTGRAFGTYQDDEFGQHAHALPEGGSDYPVYGITTGTNERVEDFSSSTVTVKRSLTNAVGGIETRPRNVALVAYIKY